MIKAVTVHCFFHGLNDKQGCAKQAQMLKNFLKLYPQGEQGCALRKTPALRREKE